jgi:hypothetical protein
MTVIEGQGSSYSCIRNANEQQIMKEDKDKKKEKIRKIRNKIEHLGRKEVPDSTECTNINIS